MQQRRCCIGERDLCRVYLGAFKAFELLNFLNRQIGEQAQEAADISVCRVAPELPVFIG